MQEWPIAVLSQPEWHGWREGVRGYDAQLAKVQQLGSAPLMFGEWPDGRKWFQWICPGCGRCSFGQIADGPVSGWNEPRWTVEGAPDHLTLTPSLGCPNWRDGICEGHWWARDGKLVPA
jgi:hypothetical protein